MVNGGGGGSGKGARTAGKSSGGGSGGTFGSTSHVDSAFGKSKGAKDNFVTLHEFRSHLGGTRDQQDAAIRAHRIGGRYTLNTHEGVAGKLGDHHKAAAVHEGGTRYVYISKR